MSDLNGTLYYGFQINYDIYTSRSYRWSRHAAAISGNRVHMIISIVIHLIKLLTTESCHIRDRRGELESKTLFLALK
jgi:hypothetical protein